jgi:Histidine kinase-like ATPase domain
MSGTKRALSPGPRAPVMSIGPRPIRQWRRLYPGDRRQLRVLRRWLATLLPACASRDDVVLVAVELATNALKFTSSGRGGWFGVEIAWCGQVVRVAVADGGAPSGPVLIDDPAGEHGRGLLMVHALSVRTGVTGDHCGRVMWAEVPWSGERAVKHCPFPAGGDAASRWHGYVAPAPGKAVRATARRAEPQGGRDDHSAGDRDSRASRCR